MIQLIGIHGIATVTKYLNLSSYIDDSPFEIITGTKNELMYGGGSSIWEMMMARWTDSFYDSGAHLGVGDGAGGGRTLNDLTGGNKFRKIQDGGYPQHVDGFAEINLHAKYRSTFTGAQANFIWREWGLFNRATGGRMLNHKVESFGRKRPGMIWQFLVEFIIE